MLLKNVLNKALKVSPPEGEFVLMNYRITADFNAPFKIFTFFETENPYKLVFNIKVVLVFIAVALNFPEINYCVIRDGEIQRAEKSIKREL